nr:Cap [Forsythia suspensa CRESS virus]
MQVTKYSRNAAGRRVATYGGAVARYAARKVGRAALRAVPIIGNAMAAYDVAKGVYGLGKKMFSRGTSTGKWSRTQGTQSEKPVLKRAYGRQNGKYMGRVRPTRRVRGGFVAKAQQKGFSIHFEKGGTINDPYCAYIGHGTCPQTILRRLMLGCLLKALIRRMGMSFSNCNQPLTFLTLGDQFIIRFRINQESATEQNITYTLPGNQPTFQNLLNGFVNAWVTSVQAATFKSSIDWLLVEAMFSPAGTGDLTACRIPLENATITFAAQSELKVQNRSVPAEGDDTNDEVDRIPLRGMIYQFSGNGTNFKRTALAAIGEVQFTPIGEKQDGIFLYGANVNGGAEVLKEPPHPYNFVRCKKYNSIRCNPGEVKSSKVNYKTTMYLSTLLKLIVGTNEDAANAAVSVLQTRGMFNLVAMEKVIETSSVASTQLIQLAWEVDYRIFGFISPKLVDNTIGEHYYGTSPSGE